MDSVQFTEFLHQSLIDRCGRGRYGLMAHLLSPEIKFDSERIKKLRSWISEMDSKDQEAVRMLMDACVDTCLFGFAAIADGVSGFNQDDYLQISLTSGGATTEIARGNAPGGTDWHDTVAAVAKRHSDDRLL